MIRSLTARFTLEHRRRLPMILQGETAECGLACLAMVAGFFGHQIDLLGLRRLWGTSLRGATLKDLMDLAHRLHLSARPLQIDDVDDLRALSAPAILHWDFTHFVVLKRVHRDKATIHDPAAGVQQIPLQELSKHFTGIALELLPAPEFTRVDARQPLGLGDFFRHVVGLKRYLARVVIMSLAVQALAILSPLFIQLVVDETLIRRDRALLDLLALGFLVIAGVQATLNWARSLAVTYLANTLSLQVQSNLLRRVVHLPMEFFLKRHAGDISSRLTSSVSLHGPVTTGLVTAVVDGFTFLFATSMLLAYAPALFAVAAAILAGYLLLRALWLRVQRDVAARNVKSLSESNNELWDTIRSITTVKILGLELDRLNRWRNRYVDATNTSIQLARINLGFSIASQTLLTLGQITAVYFGSRLIMDETLSVGMLMAFLAYQTQFFSSGMNLADLWGSLQLLSVHLDRLRDIVLAPTEKQGDPAEYAADPTARLQLRDICFRYGAGEPLVLTGVDLTIAPGECVAIMGASGAGKSTLLRIMLGLMRPMSGTVKFAGVDIYEAGPAAYRRSIAAVSQDDRLFSGTIAENITSFAAQPDQGRMIECAQRCFIHETIIAMPMGYYSQTGDIESALSAGERQRLMIARALYRQPRILFLDEATSNLDLELDRKVNEALNENLGRLGIARLVITHRDTPLTYADRVLRLSMGRLEEVLVASRARDVTPSSHVHDQLAMIRHRGLGAHLDRNP